MVTGNLDSLVQEASIERALDGLDGQPDDTGLLVESNIDGQRVTLTSMIDGLPRGPIPRMHAKRVLGKKIPGTELPAFWIPGMPYEPPPPIRGSILCMLHPDFDEADGPAGFDRAFVDAAGLAGFNCNRGDPSKNNASQFQSVYDRDQHMQSKHDRQLKMIEKAQGTQAEIEEKAERQLDREVQQATAAAILAAAGVSLPEPVTEAAPAETVELPDEVDGYLTVSAITVDAGEADMPEQQAAAELCATCGGSFKDLRGLKAHQRLSKDEAHAAARDA